MGVSRRGCAGARIAVLGYNARRDSERRHLELISATKEPCLIHDNFQCELYFIRHGESESNATPGLAAGTNFDAPLTEKGVGQARLVGRRLRSDGVAFDRVYSSSLTRTVQTTEAMLDGLGEKGRSFTRVDAIIEQQVPGWRGVPIEEAMTPTVQALMGRKGMDFAGPQGESMRTVQRRVTTWLEDELIYNQDLVASEQSLTVASVGHGNSGRCMFQYIMGFDERMAWRVAVDNCSISRFLFDKNGWAVVSLNDSSHIGVDANFETRV